MESSYRTLTNEELLTPEEIKARAERERVEEKEFFTRLVVRVVLLIGVIGSLGMVAAIIGLAVALWRWALSL